MGYLASELLGAVDVSDAVAYSIVALVGGAFLVAAVRDLRENWRVVLAMFAWLALAVAIGYGIYQLFEHDVLKW
ncbi:MAG TPA: hypothetical protein VF549_08090 [Solirubrobacteraceae bacterium]|jgi:uncharacterized membrane protein YjjP (DUF1212 family)